MNKVYYSAKNSGSDAVAVILWQSVYISYIYQIRSTEDPKV